MVNDNQPSYTPERWLYPFVFKSQSKQFSYGSKLHVIEDCGNSYSLCKVCPSGRSYMTKVEYTLLATNGNSALIGCSNVERCNEYLVKVIFS